MREGVTNSAFDVAICNLSDFAHTEYEPGRLNFEGARLDLRPALADFRLTRAIPPDAGSR